MRAALAAALALTALWGCAGPNYPVAAPPTPAPARGAAEPPPAALPVLPMPEARSVAPRRQTPASDSCGAAQLQGLVGQPRSRIPVPVDPSRQRVACTTCPVAEDHDPGRLNFLFDAETGLIKQIRCG